VRACFRDGAFSRLRDTSRRLCLLPHALSPACHLLLCRSQINTFALVARRNVPLGRYLLWPAPLWPTPVTARPTPRAFHRARSPAYQVLNALFYASWALFRLFVFPALTLMYYAEYVACRVPLLCPFYLPVSL